MDAVQRAELREKGRRVPQTRGTRTREEMQYADFSLSGTTFAFIALGVGAVVAGAVFAVVEPAFTLLVPGVLVVVAFAFFASCLTRSVRRLEGAVLHAMREHQQSAVKPGPTGS